MRHLKPNVNLVGVVGPTRLVGAQPDLYSFLKHNFHCLQGGLLIDHRHLHHTLQDTFLIFQVMYFAGIIPYDCLSLSDDYIRFDNSNLLYGSWFFSDLAWNQSQIWLHLFTDSLGSKPCLMALEAAGPASHYAVFVAAGVVLHSSGTCFFDCWVIGHHSQIVTELGSVNKKRLQDNFQFHEELLDVEDVSSLLKQAFQSWWCLLETNLSKLFFESPFFHPR